MYYCYFK